MPTHLDPCVLVLFGATGDLTRRKLTPALYALHCDGHLPAGFQVVAYGRRDKDDASFRADLLAHMQQFAPKAEMSKWEDFASQCFYVRGEFDVQSDYDLLAARLALVPAAYAATAWALLSDWAAGTATQQGPQWDFGGLPLSAAGKVLKNVLREQVREQVRA